MKTIEQVEALITNTGHCQIQNCDCKENCKERIKILDEWENEIQRNMMKNVNDLLMPQYGIKLEEIAT